MYTYIHTYTCKYIRACMHARMHMHGFILSCTHTYLLVCSLASLLPYLLPCLPTYSPTYPHTHRDILLLLTYMFTHVHPSIHPSIMFACMHACMHAYKQFAYLRKCHCTYLCTNEQVNSQVYICFTCTTTSTPVSLQVYMQLPTTGTACRCCMEIRKRCGMLGLCKAFVRGRPLSHGPLQPVAEITPGLLTPQLDAGRGRI